MSKFINVTSKNYPLTKEAKSVFKQLGTELATIEKEVPEIEQIIARGGFVLDTLLGVKPNDIDFFYSLKGPKTLGWQGCKCDEIKAKMKALELPLINSRKSDLCHILEGEIFFPPVEKVLGPFTHHIEMCSQICLDSNGDLWTSPEAFYFIKNRVEENRPEAFLQHAFYPYSENPYYKDPNTSYIRRVLRALRMIHTKRYTGVGPHFLEFIENCGPVFEVILANKKYRQAIADFIREKNSMMKLADYKMALTVTKANNQTEVLADISKIIS